MMLLKTNKLKSLINKVNKLQPELRILWRH